MSSELNGKAGFEENINETTLLIRIYNHSSKAAKKRGASMATTSTVAFRTMVPRESLLFVITSFSGVVSWEGDGAPFKESNQDINYQIVDRPTQRFLHRILSPFVDNEAEGYVPEYADTIKRLQAAAIHIPLVWVVGLLLTFVAWWYLLDIHLKENHVTWARFEKKLDKNTTLQAGNFHSDAFTKSPHKVEFLLNVVTSQVVEKALEFATDAVRIAWRRHQPEE
ncbi:pescadillo [Tanacetum coccineum]